MASSRTNTPSPTSCLPLHYKRYIGGIGGDLTCTFLQIVPEVTSALNRNREYPVNYKSYIGKHQYNKDGRRRFREALIAYVTPIIGRSPRVREGAAIDGIRIYYLS